MIVLQAVASGISIGVLKNSLKNLTAEVQTLRNWKDQAAPRQAIYDKYEAQLEDHEKRIRELERMRYRAGKSFEPGPRQQG